MNATESDPYGLSPTDHVLLAQLRHNKKYNELTNDRTSPTTFEEQSQVLAKYILEAQRRGVEFSITKETVDIDSLNPIHLELDGEQLDFLERIYKEHGIPPIIIEQVNGKYILLDGHHRSYLAKYRLKKREIDASIIHMGTHEYDTVIGKTFGELGKDEFIIE